MILKQYVLKNGAEIYIWRNNDIHYLNCHEIGGDGDVTLGMLENESDAFALQWLWSVVQRIERVGQ